MTNNFNQKCKDTASNSEILANTLIKLFTNAPKPEASSEKKTDKIEEISEEDESVGKDIRSHFKLKI